MAISEIIDKQMPSLTEWLEQAGFKQSQEFRQEDNSKRDRLEILFQTTGLTYDRPAKFSASELKNRDQKFTEFLDQAGDKLCALRLIPLTAELPKLRVRGKTLRENLHWFDEQNIDVEKYRVEVVPHSGHDQFSATFLINDHGIVGEIVEGLHWQLTQGLHENEPTYFNFDFNNWNFSKEDKEAIKWVKQAVSSLQINRDKQELIQRQLSAEFTPQNYLKGYFEFVVWPDNKIYFIDYNRIIYQSLKDLKINNLSATTSLSGICASPGKISGPAKIIFDPKNSNLNDGDILICSMTMIDYVPLMKKAGGIITAQGNILSHAAIVARELKKPCLVGVKDILTKIEDGQIVTLDADQGQIVLN